MKTAIRKELRKRGFEVTRLTRSGADGFSYSLYDQPIADWIKTLGVTQRVAVDIGAADGKQGSNTYQLFRSGWSGLAAEANGLMFDRLAGNYSDLELVALYRGFVTTANVSGLLTAAGVPVDFGLLSLDIDGCDYDVLRGILEIGFRPGLIFAEINAKIPPPVKFAVRDGRGFMSRGNDSCNGMSLSAAVPLAEEHGYVLLGVDYNNAYFAPAENPSAKKVEATDAFQRGYVDRQDRLKIMPWDEPFDHLRAVPPEQVVAFYRDRFQAYEGMFDLST